MEKVTKNALSRDNHWMIDDWTLLGSFYNELALGIVLKKLKKNTFGNIYLSFFYLLFLHKYLLCTRSHNIIWGEEEECYKDLSVYFDLSPTFQNILHLVGIPFIWLSIYFYVLT